MDLRDAVCTAQFVSVCGRRVAFHVDGPADAPAVVLLHGLGGGRKIWILPEPPTNVRLVAITRPGYGESDDVDLHHYSHEVLVSCVKAVLDSLGISKFHVIGHSAGGPYALACKALAPDRCMRCIVLSGDSEYGTNPAIDPFKGPQCCLPGHLCGCCALAMLPCLLRCCCCLCVKPPAGKNEEPKIKDLKAAEVEELEQLGPAAKDFVAHRKQAMYDALGGGRRANGLQSDFIVQNKPWRFKAALSDGTVCGKDVVIWQGEEDTVVPLATSKYTQSLVPGSVLSSTPGRLRRDGWVAIGRRGS